MPTGSVLMLKLASFKLVPPLGLFTSGALPRLKAPAKNSTEPVGSTPLSCALRVRA